MESMEEVAGEVDGPTGEKITGAVTNVYEACNFQDITGQRITKVVRTLKQVEDKVDALLAAFGEDAAQARAEQAAPNRKAEPECPEAKERALMNGPAGPGDESVSQDDIDALLASFD
jgi:chemotaxis protein CheZ